MEEDYTYSDEKMIPFTKIKDLKYQKSKPFKAVSILNNQYIFETSTKLSTDETKNSIKNSNDVYTYHKTDLEKIDSPYNIMKKKKEEKNLKHNQPKEMQISNF